MKLAGVDFTFLKHRAGNMARILLDPLEGGANPIFLTFECLQEALPPPDEQPVMPSRSLFRRETWRMLSHSLDVIGERDVLM